MFSAGSNLANKKPEEIYYQDFKKFDSNGIEFGIGQVSSLDQDELDTIEKRMKPYLENAYKEQDLDVMIFMITNILTESSLILCCGDQVPELLEEAFPGITVADNEAALSNVVSQKKQMLPALMDAISRSNNEI